MKKILTIMLAAILALGMMACGNKTTKNSESEIPPVQSSESGAGIGISPIYSEPKTGINNGFTQASNDSIFIAYHFDEQEFSADNVQIDIYYGSPSKSLPSATLEAMEEHGERYSMGVVFMNWENYNLVHKNDDRFPPEIFDELSIGVSSNYAYVLRRHTITEFWDKNYYTVCDSEKGLVFTHKETLTIPQELLSDNEGMLMLAIWESHYIPIADGGEKRTAGRWKDIYLHYEYVNGKIILSKQMH